MMVAVRGTTTNIIAAEEETPMNSVAIGINNIAEPNPIEVCTIVAMKIKNAIRRNSKMINHLLEDKLSYILMLRNIIC